MVDRSRLAGHTIFGPSMKPEILLPCSQEPATGLYLRKANPFHKLTFYFFKLIFNIILLRTL
jgi:hypothetical protein